MELFVLAICSWGVACPGVWVIHWMALHWRKHILPFASRYRLQTASWLGVGTCAHFPSHAGAQHLYQFRVLISWIHKAVPILYEMFTRLKVNSLPSRGKVTLYIHLGGCWHANRICDWILTRARSKQRDSNSKVADSKTHPTVLPLPRYRESSTVPFTLLSSATDWPAFCLTWASTKKMHLVCWKKYQESSWQWQPQHRSIDICQPQYEVVCILSWVCQPLTVSF